MPKVLVDAFVVNVGPVNVVDFFGVLLAFIWAFLLRMLL